METKATQARCRKTLAPAVKAALTRNVSDTIAMTHPTTWPGGANALARSTPPNPHQASDMRCHANRMFRLVKPSLRISP